MELKNAQVLITGGSEGIGYGLATRLLKAGSTVLITGRSISKLEKAGKDSPLLHTYVNDISIPDQRQSLAEFVSKTMPGINIIINNAGIQRRVALASDNAPWTERQAEIDTLLSAPIHLNHLMIPLILSNRKPSVIINVTSGGAYIPQVFAPVYSACKAALHSYTMTLRHSLEGTNCRVVELIPPAVQTALAGPGKNHGASLDEFCDKAFSELFNDNITTVGFGPTANIIEEISGKPLDAIFKAGLSRFPVQTYTSKE